MPSHDTDPDSRQKLDYAHVKQIAGSLEPWQVSAILALGATIGELETAVAWMNVESGHSGLHRASERSVGRDSRVTAIYEILSGDRNEDEDDNA